MPQAARPNENESTFDMFKCCQSCNQTSGAGGRHAEQLQQRDAQSSVLYSDDAGFLHDEPLRKRILRPCLTLIYFLLVAIAVVVTYSMVTELVYSLNNPVRSIHYVRNDFYDAPGT